MEKTFQARVNRVRYLRSHDTHLHFVYSEDPKTRFLIIMGLLESAYFFTATSLDDIIWIAKNRDG